ncbi:unnamed protein product [Eruca vesicaria subsp. sativa]|uniref:Uncharacterized protein n=1 Tax=Eruca vesicaria subsp. sativa TaxID=29727 RepID=A0ABC8IY03_ERUVS|nr:unnamed protein product [Eruca vesicaria subsp. sativa]
MKRTKVKEEYDKLIYIYIPFFFTTSLHYYYRLLSQINIIFSSNLSFSPSLQPRVFSLEQLNFILMVSLTMEEKQLDLNRPLLSVRRPTQASETEIKTRSSDSVTNKIPPASPPVYKSDSKSGPVRNPGTVPFQWEHKPGKPKDETKPDLQRFVEPHYVPKLPPGRVRVMKPDTIPNHVEDAKSCGSRCEDDDTYLDAADMLSRSESFFYNCSNVSGHGTQMEPFGSLSSDRQTQDLMMGRFLPAAKALTSETPPPHLSRKPPKPEEPAKVVVVKEKQNKRGSFGVLNPVPSVRTQVQRGVSVRRMRSKYKDSNESQNKNSEHVNEDKMKLSVSAAPDAKEKVEKSCTSARTKVSRNFGELLASDDHAWKPSSEAPVAEKTLYVDTVHSVDKKVQEESMEQFLLKEEVQKLHGPGEEATSQGKTTEQSVIRDEAFTKCTDQANVAVQESNVVVEITKEKIDLEVKLQRNTSSRLQHRSTYHIMPPPPLPKAPSDSWLKRTLPTIPSKNNSFTWLQSLGAYDNNKINQAKPKWETMVKTSNTQQGFVCFSKESLNPIPEA